MDMLNFIVVARIAIFLIKCLCKKSILYNCLHAFLYILQSNLIYHVWLCSNSQLCFQFQKKSASKIRWENRKSVNICETWRFFSLLHTYNDNDENDDGKRFRLFENIHIRFFILKNMHIIAPKLRNYCEIVGTTFQIVSGIILQLAMASKNVDTVIFSSKSNVVKYWIFSLRSIVRLFLYFSCFCVSSHSIQSINSRDCLYSIILIWFMNWNRCGWSEHLSFNTLLKDSTDDVVRIRSWHTESVCFSF